MTHKFAQFFIKYLPDGMINFLLLAGSVCGFLSAFDISYYKSIFIVLFFVCIGLAGVCHLRGLFRLLFYLLFFALYFGGVMRYGNYLNAGFYTIINKVVDEMSIYLDITNYQEYKILIDQPEQAITIFVLFFSLFLLILINSVAADKKTILGAMFFTLPLLSVPLYIHREPTVFSQSMLVTGYLLILFSNYSKNWDKKYGIRVLTIHKLQFFSILMAVILVFTILINVVVPVSRYQVGYEEKKAKTAGYDMLSTMLMFGLSGFFNDYSGAGGMSGGRLGGINSIRPDYQTDLIVEFAPFAEEPLYLKGYTGIYYTGHQWMDEENYVNGGNSFMQDSQQEYLGLYQDYLEGEPFASQAKLRLKNIDAEWEYVYLPYYSDTYFWERQTYIEDYLTNYVTYDFYPYHDRQNKDSAAEVDDVYLQVPKDVKKTLLKILKEEKIEGNTQEIISGLQTYFEKNFTYSMSPGKTPRQEDFVTYFLTKSKKGYCSHFASSAVLMLRTMGIKARYVEGYALPAYSFADGVLQEQKSYHDYYDGYNPLGETGVIRCEINDSQAHAWVEYYDPNFGWRVAEFTPPSTEEEEEMSEGFWERFSRMLNGTDGNNDLDYSTQTEQSGNNQIGNSVDMVFRIGEILIVLSVFLLVLFKLMCIGRLYYSPNKERNLQNLYKSSCDHVRKKYPEFQHCHSHGEQISFLCEKYRLTEQISEEELRELKELLELLAFGREETVIEDYKRKHQILRKIYRRTLSAAFFHF